MCARAQLCSHACAQVQCTPIKKALRCGVVGGGSTIILLLCGGGSRMMYRSLVFVAGIAVQLLVAPLSCTAERRCLTEVFQPTSCSNFFGSGVEASLNPVDSNRLSSAQVSWPSLFPNSRNQSESDALSEFLDFSGLLHLDNYCSYLLHSFLCIHYFPPCNPSSTKNLMVLPCREVCELAMTECLNYVYEHYNATRPEHLNCTNFPVRAHACDNQASDFIVACPTPGKP